MKMSPHVISLSALLAVSAANAETLTIAFDKSGSNPLMSDKFFAASAAEFAASKIEALAEGDTVRIRGFGSRAEASNMLDQRIEVTRRQRPAQVAASVKSYIAGLPQQAAETQSSTNIVAFLEFDGALDCANGGKVLLLTDGIESSEFAGAQEFVDGAKSLPAPEVDLTGCDVTFFGLGVGLGPVAVRTVRDEWSKYVTAAGGKFNAVIK